jgi:ATP-dependent DNA helicase RecQ
MKKAQYKSASSAGKVDWQKLRSEAERFGVNHFRRGQREIIEAVLSGKDVLGVMPT